LLAVKADNDWSPFASQAGFELAEFLFTNAELSQRKINNLLKLWAATCQSGDFVCSGPLYTLYLQTIL